MRVLTGPWEGWGAPEGPSAVSIGVFDGVHLGHRMLIDRLVATDHLPTVLTFDPHPAEVLHPGAHPRLLTTLDERIDLLDEAGVEQVGVLDLSLIRYLDPTQFVSSILVGKLAVADLVIGVDFRFGRDRAGDASFLEVTGASAGFKVEVVDLVTRDGVISSSTIRELVSAGDVSEAAACLGSRYRLSAEVTRGDARGRTLGFPTANLEPPDRKVIPANGVYAAFARLGDRRLQAAVNVGVRPTFGGGALLVEAYLLDFDEEIYGEWLTLEFVEKLRPELHFESVDALIAQMSDDVEQVADLLAEVRP